MSDYEANPMYTLVQQREVRLGDWVIGISGRLELASRLEREAARRTFMVATTEIRARSARLPSFIASKHHFASRLMSRRRSCSARFLINVGILVGLGQVKDLIFVDDQHSELRPGKWCASPSLLSVAG